MTTDDTDTAATILSLARLLSDEHERAEEEKALRISTAQDLIASAKECDRLRAMHNRAADRAEEAEARLAAAERNREAAWGSEAQMAKEDLRAERARAEAAERRLAEASKPGPATERPACWAVVDGDAFKSVWTDESIARTMGEAVPLYRGWGRAELAARVADLESQLADARAEASKWYKAAADGIDAMGEHGRKEADALRARVAELKAEVEQERRLRCTLDEEDRAAWQAATSAATPGEVRRRPVPPFDAEQIAADILERREVYGHARDAADGPEQAHHDAGLTAVANLAASRAPGPVVLPVEQAPSDEEIARDLYDALTVPGAYDDIAWSVTERRNRDRWTAAVASVVRPLLARPAQTSAGGDAGREDARLRDAVVEAAIAWSKARRGITAHDLNAAVNTHLAAHAPAQIAPFDFAAYVANQERWSTATFGPGPRHAGIIDHIRKELAEIAADPADIAEWVDVIILAIDGAWRCGGATGETLAAALAAKAAKNRARTWPDWRTAPPDKAIEHDRSGEQPAPVEPAKGERFVVVRADEVNGRPAEWKRGEKLARGYADAYNAGSGIFTPQPYDGRWHHCEYAVIDTAPPVATPAPSDVERLAAAIDRADCIADMWSATSMAERILRHLAVPLPGVDHFEELASEFIAAARRIDRKWFMGIIDKNRAEAVEAMRRAMLAVGAQEPARVSVIASHIIAAIDGNSALLDDIVTDAVRFYIGRTVSP